MLVKGLEEGVNSIQARERDKPTMSVVYYEILPYIMKNRKSKNQQEESREHTAYDMYIQCG